MPILKTGNIGIDFNTNIDRTTPNTMHQGIPDKPETSATNDNLPDDILHILQSCRTLPSVPSVVMEVLDLSQDPDIGTAKIAKVISRDPALVAKILKVANSAWYGVRREVAALNQAVNLLGINGTMSLALSFSLVGGLQKTSSEAFNHQAYWRRSVIAATAALSVGKFLKSVNNDEIFLASLLQDIGMLVLNEAVRTYGKMVASAKSDHNLLVEIEQKELGTDHAHIGGWFLEKWGLPGILVASVSASHRMGGIADPMAKSVAVGGRIAEIWTNPQTAAATARTAESLRSLMDFSPDQVDLILAKTAADLPEITGNLDIPVGDESFINGLLDQAREALAELNVRALQEARHFAVQAQRDALTSLYNRSHLNQVLGPQFDLCRSLAQPLTIIFIDIDRFKNINDTYGHHAGDAVLISVAQVIQAATRDADTLVRFGGDEFVVLLNNTGEDVAHGIAERIRSMVEVKPHPAGNGSLIDVTVSVGWATLSSMSNIRTARELLEAADRSLYAAKSGGRNRVAQAV
jgi:diguanylate cyclase (GGDEF)-like protein